MVKINKPSQFIENKYYLAIKKNNDLNSVYKFYIFKIIIKKNLKEGFIIFSKYRDNFNNNITWPEKGTYNYGNILGGKDFYDFYEVDKTDVKYLETLYG